MGRKHRRLRIEEVEANPRMLARLLEVVRSRSIPTDEIAAQFGTTKQTIASLVSRHGIRAAAPEPSGCERKHRLVRL